MRVIYLVNYEIILFGIFSIYEHIVGLEYFVFVFVFLRQSMLLNIQISDYRNNTMTWPLHSFRYQVFV